MTPETVPLIRYQVARAHEALAEATLLLAHEHVATALNRLYYAGFYAVSALLLSEGRSSPKHSGIRALFDQHWIAAGRLPKDLGRLYRDLFDARQKGDYKERNKNSSHHPQHLPQLRPVRTTWVPAPQHQSRPWPISLERIEGAFSARTK